MAIKLKVQDSDPVKLKILGSDTLNMGVSQGVPIYPNPYTGAVEVTPSEELQTLETRGLMMTENVKVNPIPSNYGLITYNGSTITVS